MEQLFNNDRDEIMSTGLPLGDIKQVSDLSVKCMSLYRKSVEIETLIP
jgi:hypothetical protein